MKSLILYSTLFATLSYGAPVLAAGPIWAWTAGVVTNNGAITLKSINGSSTYSATQNPTGTAVNINQNAVTQPPLMIIQSTGGSANPWSLAYVDRTKP